MSRTKTIYFLSAFVLIIGCFALNKSYSLFVDSEEKEIVSSTVPSLDVTLSMDSITVEAGKEYLIKQTVTNNSVVPVNFGIKTNSVSTNYTVQVANDGTDTNLSYGTIDAKVSETESSYKDVYLVVKNTNTDTNTDPITVNFELKYNYSTLNYNIEDVTNINNEKYDIQAISIPYGDKTNTLTNKILLDFVKSDIYTGTKTTTVTTELTNLFSNEIDKIEIPVTINSENELDVPNPTTFSEIETSEVGLYKTEDDYGTSYYYRGASSVNYVTFADMCWRIIRIAGDGSIKLILEDQDQPCSISINGNWAIPTTTGGTTYTGNFGYTEHSSNTLTASDGTKNSSTRYLMDYLHGQTNSDKSMSTAFKNFQSTFTESELSKLKSGNWCLGDNAYDSSNNLLNSSQIMDNKIKGTSFNYDSYQRLGGNNGHQPTLKCNGTIMNDWDDDETNPTSMYVGAISADEVVYAGGKYKTTNQNYYLINEEFKKGSRGANKSNSFWTLSLYYFSDSHDSTFYLSSTGNLYYFSVDYDVSAFRPSVSLASSAVISEGEGTLEKPYKIG